MAKSPEAALSSNGPMGTPVDVTSGDIERCRSRLVQRLSIQIREIDYNNEPGQVSHLLADIRALDFIIPASDAKMEAA